MRFHMVAFQLFTLLLIIAYVYPLKSDQIIGDDRNLVAHLSPDKYAHHASLLSIEYKDGDYLSVFCGASFITRQHLLTAAHCLKETEWYRSQYVVLPNKEHFMADRVYSEFHRVSEAYVPANWDFTKSISESFPQEIGVVKLEYELSENEFPSIKVLRFPEQGFSFPDTVGTIIGVGMNSLGPDEKGQLSKQHGGHDLKLRYTKFEIVNDNLANLLSFIGCNENYKFCAHASDEYEEPFGILSYGDSGSGFVFDDLLLGVFVSSQSYQKGVPNIGHFSNALYHKDTIDKMVNGNVNPHEIEKHVYQSTESTDL